MDFVKAFEFLIKSFENEKINFALIGGFAVHSAGFTRATQDIDILINRESELQDILKRIENVK